MRMSWTLARAMRSKIRLQIRSLPRRQILCMTHNDMHRDALISDEPVGILMVDDRPDKLLALEAILSPLNERMVRASSGREALEQLSKDDFAVILLDVQMPGLDGFETAALIRQNERTKDLPIIFVSAFEATEQRLERVYALGAVDYLPVPVSIAALRAKVAVFVELFRKNRALRQLIHQMDEKTKQLDGFCYSVAHDLRAPLRTMSSYAELVREEYGAVLPENGKAYLEKITAASTRLDRLIQDLLGYSKIEQMPLQGQEVDLQHVIAAALKHVEQEIQTKRANVSIRPPLPKVLSDRTALEHVFLNLISNALKFSRDGSPPAISIHSEQTGPRVRVWVEDNGIGIDPKYHRQIFRMFEKLDNSLKYPGTGVGLAIVSRTIQRLGGTTGVESQPNLGSRFWVELPANGHVPAL